MSSVEKGQSGGCRSASFKNIDVNAPGGDILFVKSMANFYRRISMYQMPVALLAILSGATTVGLAIPNPKWPFLSFMPLANGAILFTAGVIAFQIGRMNFENGLPANFRKQVSIHYGLTVSCISLCAMASTFSGIGIGRCASNDEDQREDCSPNRDVKLAFAIIDLVLAVLLTPTCHMMLWFFCKYNKTLRQIYTNTTSRQMHTYSNKQ